MKINLVNENFKSNYLQNLLAARGATDLQTFVDPPEWCLNDPALLDNVRKGICWIEEVLNKENSNILIVVDADVDGYTSGAIVFNYLHAIAPNQVIGYILHEHKQHGLEDHYEELLNSKTHYDLIILPDSSSNDYEYHEKLGSALNTKFLVLDHHDIDEGQPISDYACIINNQLSQNYPNKDLTGAGVAWQFCRYHQDHTGVIKPYADDLIDLAALGICGDMGSCLNLENRYIFKHGFNNIKNYFFQCAIEK